MMAATESGQLAAWTPRLLADLVGEPGVGKVERDLARVTLAEPARFEALGALDPRRLGGRTAHLAACGTAGCGRGRGLAAAGNRPGLQQLLQGARGRLAARDTAA